MVKTFLIALVIVITVNGVFASETPEQPYSVEEITSIRGSIIFFPPVEVKFKSSRMFIVKGKKREDGSCRFENRLVVGGGKGPNLDDDESYVRIRRALNEKKCIELVQEGVVDQDNTP